MILKMVHLMFLLATLEGASGFQASRRLTPRLQSRPPLWRAISEESEMQTSEEPGNVDIKSMIAQLEAEGFKVDESLDEDASAKVNMERLETTVRKQIDEKFESAAKEMKELAEKRKAESDERAKRKYEESLAMLENQEQDSEDRLDRFKQLAGSFDGVEKDAAMARAEMARLQEAKKELDSIASSPEFQLSAFKYKTLTQKGSLVVAVVLLLLSVNTGADLVSALAAGDPQVATGTGSRLVLEIVGAGLGSVLYGLWGDEMPKME